MTLAQATLEIELIGGTNAAVFASTFAVEGPSTIAVITHTLVPGQFPIIAYTNTAVQGASGFGGLISQRPQG